MVSSVSPFSSQILSISWVALKEFPQLLEALGIPVLSKGYVRQKPVDMPADHTVEAHTGIQIPGESPGSLANSETHGQN